MACDDQLVVLAIQRFGHFGANSLASILMPAHISSAIERGRGGVQWRAEICCEGVAVVPVVCVSEPTTDNLLIRDCWGFLGRS